MTCHSLQSPDILNFTMIKYILHDIDSNQISFKKNFIFSSIHVVIGKLVMRKKTIKLLKDNNETVNFSNLSW